MRCLLSFRLKSKHEKLAGNKKKNRLLAGTLEIKTIHQLWRAELPSVLFVATCVTTNCIISIYAQKEKHFFLIFLKLFFSSHLRN
ncbi:hypothetical protein D3073_15495 [Enterococcus faecalis]|nr:hypothetical protein [Enterococcus faecalis]